MNGSSNPVPALSMPGFAPDSVPCRLMKQEIQIVECPRDAMQGWSRFIATEDKVRYINLLLQAGFHTVDFGSFVSPRWVPQMADTALVLEQLTPSDSALLAIVANLKGATDAMQHGAVQYIGFPFSISDTFQQRNTNSSREASLHTVEEIARLCHLHQKQLVVYMSMGFGNPYGDPYSMEILAEWTFKIHHLGVRIISLADTVGLATPVQVFNAVHQLTSSLPDAVIGVHLHAAREGMVEKLAAALDAGCKRVDGAIAGIGGCPMADDVLVGNMDTRVILEELGRRGIQTGVDLAVFREAEEMAQKIFIH